MQIKKAMILLVQYEEDGKRGWKVQEPTSGMS